MSLFLCSAILTSPPVFAQFPNKPMLALVNTFIHSKIPFFKRKTPFHSALFSNQKQRCAEISKPEGNRSDVQVITAVPVPPLEQPLPTRVCCSSVLKHHSAASTNTASPSQRAPTLHQGEELVFLTHSKDRESR